ncbi:hypothetical protein [Bergeriella denitrificans]|uniref:Uncharacterized protein n=1 Tax=Bergeriella denitrificans TaxID=494 RepID=A0A378UJ16_BERDE|nr:hypothetical protein [Bergeriella denitrificans]STZ77384.1 Uncharacterised protein [Bergeriella denitrificans]STZ83004.1 Uncharacterised protein [Bergeriella denitrificans]
MNPFQKLKTWLFGRPAEKFDEEFAQAIEKLPLEAVDIPEATISRQKRLKNRAARKAKKKR